MKSLIKGIKDKEEQAIAIYSYLLQHFTIVEKPFFWVENNINKCFQEKMASRAELNLMMIAILRHLDIADAKPVLISTLDNGKTIENYATLYQFNHVLVYAKINGNVRILDLANNWNPYGYPSLSSLNGKGLLIQSDKVDAWDPYNSKFDYKWISITRPLSSKIFVGNFSLSKEGTLSGHLDMQYMGHAGGMARGQLADDLTNNNWKEKLQEKYPQASFSDLIVKNKSDINTPLELKTECTLPEAAQVMGDYMYLNPILYPSFNKNPFTSDERKYEIDFPMLFKHKQVIKIEIPKGYAIEELPSSQRFKVCLLYTSPSPRDATLSRMPSSA